MLQESGAPRGRYLITEQSIASWLDSLSSASATPGGGSSTAIMGAMAAALVSMVCRHTLDKNPASALRDTLASSLESAEGARVRLMALIEEDVAAFDAVMAAYGRPRANPSEQAARSGAIQAAMQQATLVPLACAAVSRQVLELAVLVSEQGHRNAFGEAAVASLAAQAGFRASALNVSLNLGSIKDPAFVETQRAELARLRQEYDRLDGRVSALLQGRTG
jgi:formiminotetrahydrofolate cyclodeaminase